MVNVTKARKVTAGVLRYGHYQSPDGHSYAYCPQCKHRVEAWGYLPKLLPEAMVRHLVEVCEVAA